MTRRLPLALVGWMVVALAAGACGGTPTGPGPSAPRTSYAPLDVRCWIEAELLCSVHRFGEGDLTARAEWFATDVIWGTVAFPGVTFPRPGVPVATRPVRLYIAARVGTEARASSFAYEMAPGARPIPLALLTGFVFEGDTGFTGLEGVKVEILDGEGVAGFTATTNLTGSYSISYVRVGVPFTMRASRTGYEPSVVRHDGIKMLPEGLPDFATTAQHFRLKKQP